MESNSFETDEVMAAGNLWRNSSRPAVVVGDHLCRGPSPLLYRSTEQTGLVDLELHDQINR